MDEKMAELAECLDWDLSSVSRETPLDSLRWDSMAMLTVMAMARVGGKSLGVDDIRKMKNVGDIVDAL